MRPEPDMNSIVRSWLEPGANRLPDRVLDSVLDQLPAYPQHRPRWPLRRFPVLMNPVRIAIVAAAVLAVSLVAIRFLPGDGPGGIPSPTPLPTSSGTALTAADLDRSLEAGRYALAAPFLQPFSITMPSGWSLKSLVAGDVSFRRNAPADGAPWVTIDVLEGVFADPCRTEAGPSPAPTTIDGVVAALTSMVDFEAGPVTDVTIGGHAGKSVTLTNAIDTETAGCTGGPMLPLFTILGGAEAGTNGGATERLSILDVDGTIVVINGGSFANTPAATLADVGPIIESIDFE